MRQILGTLRSGYKTIGLALILSLLCGAAYLAVTPKTYQAETVLLIDPKVPNIVPSAAVADGVGQDAAMLESQVEIISSRQLLFPLFQDLKLAEDSEFSGGGLLSRLTGSHADNPHAEQDAFDKFTDTLKVERRGLTYILTIAVKSKDADKAARLANAIAERYVSEQIAKKSGSTRDATSMLEGRLIELRAGVDQAERQVEDFKASEGFDGFSQGPALFESELMQASQQLSTATANQSAAEARYKQLVTAAKGGPQNFGAIDSVTAAQLRSQYNARQAELQRLTNTLGARHPNIQSQKLEMNELQRQMQREADRVVDGARLDLNVANSNLATTKAKVDQLVQTNRGMRQAEVQLRALEREADARRKVLEEYLQRSRETGEQASMARPDAEVITAAVPPSKATWPKGTVVLALAGFVGLAGGIVLAFLRSGMAAAKVTRAVEPARDPEPEPEPVRRRPARPPVPSLLSQIPPDDPALPEAARPPRRFGTGTGLR
jgi:uncharacterized protein involved in exopolysaccharide biosynthesis